MTSVDIAIPAYNEERNLEQNITKLLQVLHKREFSGFKITIYIVNNASSDATPQIAQSLAKQYKNVNYMSLSQKGRGRALLTCWSKSRAEIVAYMDADLSADLTHLKELLDAVAVRGADIAIGSRLKKGAKVTGRTLTREVMSRGYNLLIRLIFQTQIKDAQCGFKAVSRKKFQMLAPLIKNRNWFLDSEMLIIAMKAGMTIEEIPISWKDDPSSTVKILKTAKEDLTGLIRLARTKPWKSILSQ